MPIPRIEGEYVGCVRLKPRDSFRRPLYQMRELGASSSSHAQQPNIEPSPNLGSSVSLKFASAKTPISKVVARVTFSFTTVSGYHQCEKSNTGLFWL